MTAAVAAARWLADVPVAPSATQARALAREELAHRAYRDAAPGLLQRAVRAVLDALAGLGVPSGSSPLRVAALVVVLLLLAAAVALAVRLTGRVGRGAAAAGPVLTGGARSADELRRDADAAAAQGRWEDAVAMRFRAVVRALQERDLLDSAPGLTAGEAGAGAALALPPHAGALRSAAALFDAVVYGGRGASAEDAERLRDLDAAVAGTRPQLAADAVAGR